MQYRSEFPKAHQNPDIQTQKQPSNFSKTLQAGSLMLLAALGFSACRETTTQPVLYRIDVPGRNQLDVEIELTQRIGLGLSGQFDIDVAGTRYAVIRLEPETSNHGFRLGLQLDLGLFIPETLGAFNKVRALPTGQAFASWIRGEMVNLSIPEANLPELSWNFYFGTGGRIAFGAAATISAINGNFPSLSLDYAFRDAQGRMILGVQFYGPGRNAQGHPPPRQARPPSVRPAAVRGGWVPARRPPVRAGAGPLLPHTPDET
jgi:hypothetical protein